MYNSMSPLQSTDEKLRLEIKKLADETRLKYTLKGLTDIFKIIENTALLIRKPLKTKEVSGFTTYFNGTLVVFLNSSFSLGHEIFTAAHELYHIQYDMDVLRREKIIIENHHENDNRANIFSAEFLMPEDLVKEMFFKLVNVRPDELEARHVVRMLDYFRVSYNAMLKRLLQLELCNVEKYAELLQYCTVEQKDILQGIMKSEDSDMSLIIPSNMSSITKEYLEMARSNYEKGRISYNKIKELLGYLGYTPEQFNYHMPQDEDFI